MNDRYGMEERERASWERASSAHGGHDVPFGRDPRVERAAVASRHKSEQRKRRVRREIPGRDDLVRKISELQALVANLTDVIRQMSLRQTPTSSVLDEVLLSLEQKERQSPIEIVKISPSLISALSAEYDD